MVCVRKACESLSVFSKDLCKTRYRGGSRIFFRRGCTRPLLYFNTNKPHSFFCRIPVVLENGRSSQRGGVRTPCTLPLDPPLRYTMYKGLWYPSSKPFFYAIKVIDIGFFCDCSDKCHLQSKELLAMICQRSLLAPSERVFHFFLVFFENLPR